jgi:regulator of replication initiation timing
MLEKTIKRYDDNTAEGKNRQDRIMLFTIAQILDEILDEVKELKLSNENLAKVIQEITKPKETVEETVTKPKVVAKTEKK